MKQTKDARSYELNYPSFLCWPQLINVIEEETVVEKGGERFIVKQIIRPVIPGSKTRIVLEKINGPTT